MIFLLAKLIPQKPMLSYILGEIFLFLALRTNKLGSDETNFISKISNFDVINATVNYLNKLNY